jgi:hypothetical protein
MGGWVGNLINGISLGLIDTNKSKKASGGAAASLEEEKKDSAKKRKALYGTQGGVLGQEVNQVGQSYRGNIFGN